MIKEFFEIEAKQKNTFLVFLGLFLISFLQIYIFKKNLLEGNFFIIIGLSLALALCWTILNTLPIMLITIPLFDSDDEHVIYEKFIFASGTLIIAGQILLTYIGYKDRLHFEEFIDFAWKKTLISYGVIFGIILLGKIAKTEKENKNKNNQETNEKV